MIKKNFSAILKTWWFPVGPYADGDSYEIDTGLYDRFRDQKNEDGEPMYTLRMI